MRKIEVALLSALLFLIVHVRGQDIDAVLNESTIHIVRSITSSDEDYSDLLFLKEVLKDKSIVLLGEQSHGDGATFEAKVRLIKFLHQELGFTMLSFESDFYDNFKAYNRMQNTSIEDSPLRESIFRIWSDTKEFEPLLRYIKEKSTSSNPLIVSGFDCQGDEMFEEEFLADVRKLKLDLSDTDFAVMEQVIAGGAEFIATSKEDSAAFAQTSVKLLRGFDKLSKTNPSVEHQVLQQTLISWLAWINYSIDVLHEKEIKVQNPRDLQMALNLISLSKIYPGRKMIGWGASYHFADQLETIRFSDLTKKFVNRLDSLEKNDGPSDIEKSLEGAIPMGKVLKAHFGSSLYSIAFSSFEGNFGMLGTAPTSLTPLQPPSGSIEYALAGKGYRNAFVDWKNKDSNQLFYSSALGNLPLLAPWQKIFDGLLFIKTSYPPSFPTVKPEGNKEPISSVTVNHKISDRQSEMKKVIDQHTKEGIGFVTISLLNATQGVISNAVGEFVFHIGDKTSATRIVLSSIGYETDTINIAQFDSQKEFYLRPKLYQLGEVQIRSKPLSAKEIIRKAEKAIDRNYYQLVNQQEVFYRVSNYEEDSLSFNEEAAILVHDPDGYRASGNASRNLKGQILQFRNTTQNQEKDVWSGVGSLWLMYSHDLILDKDNVLHRPFFYDLVVDSITSYDNKRVYEISFDCKRPGAFTTGFGYPAPRSTKGKIFIDVDTYSILKIETFIERRPYTNKRKPDLTRDPYTHHLIETYKLVDGKYFLNYSRQMFYWRLLNTKTQEAKRFVSIRELLSTEVIVKPKTDVLINLSNIKSVATPVNADFWMQHNTIVKDNIDEVYQSLDVKRDK